MDVLRNRSMHRDRTRAVRDGKGANLRVYPVGSAKQPVLVALEVNAGDTADKYGAVLAEVFGRWRHATTSISSPRDGGHGY